MAEIAVAEEREAENAKQKKRECQNEKSSQAGSDNYDNFVS